MKTTCRNRLSVSNESRRKARLSLCAFGNTLSSIISINASATFLPRRFFGSRACETRISKCINSAAVSSVAESSKLLIFAALASKPAPIIANELTEPKGLDPASSTIVSSEFSIFTLIKIRSKSPLDILSSPLSPGNMAFALGLRPQSCRKILSSALSMVNADAPRHCSASLPL